MQLHPELKNLKAQLIRLNFEAYLHSEAFRLLCLEINIDHVFSQAMEQTSRFSKERRTDAFLLILNSYLLHWINAIPNSEQSKSLYKEFVLLIKNVITNYFSTHKDPVDGTPIVESLHRMSMMEKEDVLSIQKMLTEIEQKKAAKHVQPVTNTKVIVPQKQEHTQMEQIDYAIITALEEDEMEKILPFITKISEIGGSRHLIEIGTLGNNPPKKVVYASQHSTGMVDASILASELILTFKPKYLIMIGVLGGKPEDTKIGDVIIATKVFEVDKGKLSETGFKKESSVATITNKAVKKIHRAKKEIEAHLSNSDQTRATDAKLHFGPIACVNQVIDLQDFFDQKVTSVDRKAIALEMESFAVVRACELLNEGGTTSIIIKSVMDNTSSKNDNNKSYAAWTSARTLEFLLTSNII